MPFKIYEPHPTATQTTYTHTGRGGFGNHFYPGPTTSPSTATGPASLFTHGLPTSSTKFSCGRGGAGNIHPIVKKTLYDFDDELKRQSSRESQGTQYIGRGGAGNWKKEKRKESRSSEDRGSSEGRRSSSFIERLSGTFERR